MEDKNNKRKPQRNTKDEEFSMLLAEQYKMEKLILKTEKNLLPSSLLNSRTNLESLRLPSQT